MPAAGDQPERSTEDSGEETALWKKDIELLIDKILAATHTPEEPVNFRQHDDVDHCDGEQEEHRDQRADHAGDFDQSREALLQAARRQGNPQRGGKHHGGVAEREVKTDCDLPSCINLRVTLSIAAM